jgi:hypothetical protein
LAGPIHRINKIISNKQKKSERREQKGGGHIYVGGMDSRGVQMKDSHVRSSDHIEMNGMETRAWEGNL